MAATLEGLEAPSGARTLEVKPYALGGVSTDNTVTPALSHDGDGRVGAGRSQTRPATVAASEAALGEGWLRVRDDFRNWLVRTAA